MLHVDDVTPLPGPGPDRRRRRRSTRSTTRSPAFVRATLKAMNEIAADPSIGLDAAIAAVPELGQDRATAGGDPRRDDRRRGAGRRAAAPADSGAIDRAGWEASIDYMTKLGLVPNPVTVDDLVDEDVPVRRPEARAPPIIAACPTVDLPGSAAVRAPRPGAVAARRRRDARRGRWARRGRRRGPDRVRRRRRPSAPAGVRGGAVDLRPWVVLPGLVDLHAHLPQVPNAGLGFALTLLDLARPADVPDRAVVGRPRRRRAARAGDLPGVRRRRDDDGARPTASSTRRRWTPRSGRPRRTGSGRSSAR